MSRMKRLIKMLKKLKICCSCGSKNSVVVPSDYPSNQRKNSEDESGISEPRDLLEHSKTHSPARIHPTHRQDIGKVS